MANTFIHKDQEYHVGDTVKVHLLVTEGDKTRTQIFEGLILSTKGRGTGKSFIVRKIGAGSIGVERILPVESPSIEKIEIKSLGKVRRSKLYYLRDRLGKRAIKVKTRETVKPKALPKTQ